MPRLDVLSYHCILESTWGPRAAARTRRRNRESDEIAFFMAMLPIDTGGSEQWTDWVYSDSIEDRAKRIRSNDDVDSGEDHSWRFPIAFDFDANPNTIFEVILQIYEVDGGTETARQAQEIHDNVWQHIEDNLRPGLGIGSSPDSRGNSGPTTYEAAFKYGGHGGNDDLMFADVWHLDPAQPMAPFNIPAAASAGPGRLDPDLQIAQQRSRLGVDVEVSRFPPRPGTVVERREYSSSHEHAIYRFDVHYSE